MSGSQRKVFVPLPEGHRTGKLTVLRVPALANSHTRVLCRCDCGVEKEIAHHTLTRARSVISCGCHRASLFRTHGHSRSGVFSAEYMAWESMRQRCLNRNYHKYPRYGGRGITVCERWNEFTAFLADMGPRPSKQHSLDRYPDNDGPYAPDNCRWATRSQQQRNRGVNRRIEIDGVTKTSAEWAEIAGISNHAVASRIYLGWSPRDAVMVPVKPRKRRASR